MDVDALRRSIKEDRAAGLQPFCVVGTAGTVNTGATDDLAALADLCRDEELWFHVDGAFGALDHSLRRNSAPRLAGIECADSLAFDFHKWLHVPYDAGCLLGARPGNAAGDVRRSAALSGGGRRRLPAAASGPAISASNCRAASARSRFGSRSRNTAPARWAKRSNAIAPRRGVWRRKSRSDRCCG